MLVIVRNNDVNKALRKLKKKLWNEGIVREIRDKRFYEKPSDKKRRIASETYRRKRKEQLAHWEELMIITPQPKRKRKKDRRKKFDDSNDPFKQDNQ